MARYFKIPFASTGDKVVIPDATQPDGSVSFTQGFGFDYERPNTDPAYKPVPREGTNGILHDVTEAVGVIQRQGVADWTIDAQPYPINAQVYHNGKQWLALRANSVAPTEGADWSGIGTANQLATKANTSTQVIAGTGLSGGGTLAANRTLSVNYGTAEGTAAQGNDSRITDAVQKSQVVQATGTSTTNIMSQKTVTDALATKAAISTKVIAGTGLSGGGTLDANRTLSIAFSHTPIGVEQTWQDVTKSRAVNTTYTNSTGKPIQLSILSRTDAPGSPSSMRLEINGVTVISDHTGTHNGTYSLSQVVPPMATYRLVHGSNMIIRNWAELR